MSFRSWLESARTRLDVTAGLVDGILTALTLASGKLLDGVAHPGVTFALRVGAATSLTTLFVFFVAHYAEMRADIHRAERELNLMAHGKLATGALGWRAVEESFAGALVAAVCGLLGAMVPLLLCYFMPSPRWLGLAITVALLGLLGAILARSFQGAIAIWAIALMAGGIVLTWIGLQLDIAG
jgi:predicted membrane protein (TIGR00267 family)